MPEMWLYHTWTSLRPLLGLFWRFRFTGEVDAIPRKGPLIVAANHSSFLDPWFICILFPRPVRFLVTRQWYYKNRLWKAFFEAQGTTPVRETAARTLASVCGLLGEGKVLGVFPEGRIAHDGRIHRFRTGIAHIAAASGAPVVPVGISGAYESLPRSRRFPRPGPITLRVGTPLRFPASPVRGKPPNREVVVFRDRLYRAISKLAGHPGERPARAGSPSSVAEISGSQSAAD